MLVPGHLAALALLALKDLGGGLDGWWLQGRKELARPPPWAQPEGFAAIPGLCSPHGTHTGEGGIPSAFLLYLRYLLKTRTHMQ